MLKNSHLILLSCAAGLFVTVSQFPLGLALSIIGLEGKGVSIERVSGSIWSGDLHNVQFGGLALGRVAVHGKPLTALSGGAAAYVEWRGAESSGAALLEPKQTAIALTELEMRMPMAAQGLRGVAVISNGNVEIAEDNCTSASGEIVFNSGESVDVYSGTLACDDASLVAVMTVGGANISVPLRSAAS